MIRCDDGCGCGYNLSKLNRGPEKYLNKFKQIDVHDLDYKNTLLSS